jgi:hypothetical protein
MRSTRFTFLLALLGLVLAALPAHAPNTRGPQSRTLAPGAISPERVKSGAEEEAGKLQDSFPRYPSFYSFYSNDPKEFAGLAKYAVFLVTVWTQKAEELPVKRLFIRAPRGVEIPVLSVSSWRTPVEQGSATAKRYGPYRQDGFYLVPTGPLLREGQIIIDLSAGVNELVLLELPLSRASSQDPKDKILSGDPAPGAKPNLKVLQDFIRRDFPGFPVPQSVQ